MSGGNGQYGLDRRQRFTIRTISPMVATIIHQQARKLTLLNHQRISQNPMNAAITGPYETPRP